MSELINALNVLPKEWAKTPVTGDKRPYLKDWQKDPASIEKIAQEIKSGQAKGFGIITGTLSGGIMAIDCDGHVPHARFKEILGGDIPHTVAFASGKEGRAQYLFSIEQEHWASIRTIKEGDPKKGGQLEMRWDGHQSVLPPSAHPETGSYKWISSFEETAIAQLPNPVLQYLLKQNQFPDSKPSKPIPTPSMPNPNPFKSNPKPILFSSDLPPIPIERCLSKAHRDALAGVSNGCRTNKGVSLARDLVGTAARLESLGQSYTGDPYSLFTDYCSRCTPPLTTKEQEGIWKATEGEFKPSIRSETAFQNCIKKWKRECTKSYQQSNRVAETSFYNGNGFNHEVNQKPQYPLFESNFEDGLFKNNVKVDRETGELKLVKERIGNHLEGMAYVNNPDKDDAAIYIKFKTIQGGTQSWIMPRSGLVHETTQMLAELQKRSYYYNLDKKTQLIEYLNALGTDIEKTYTITESTGWINNSYVSHNKTYSINEVSDLKFRDIEPSPDAISEIKGTLAEWQEHVGKKCANNSRLIFAIGTGLAAPLQKLVGMESGGFHIVGPTSVGKTTILKVAASVVGIKDIPQWRTTTNGLESIACAHNDTLLPMDEIGQAEPKEAGSIAYMLANGQGKNRMTKNLEKRKPKTWRTLFLSSGELGLAAYIAQAGLSLKGGQEVRLPDVPAVPYGSEFGVFESVHSCDSGKDFAESLDRATKKYHGALFNAFLEKLVIDLEDECFSTKLENRVKEIERKLTADATDTAVARVSNRYALIQLALELAFSYGLLPFSFNNIEWAMTKIFTDWFNARGGDGSIEIKNALARIRHLLVTNLHSDRIYTLPLNNSRTIRHLLAYRKANELNETEELLVPKAVFDSEICAGLNKSMLVKELQNVGLLIPPRADGKATHQRSVDGKSNYYYIFRMEEETASTYQAEERQNGCKPVPETLSPITLSSHNHLQASYPAPEALSASAEATTIAQNPLETSQLPSNGVDNIKNQPISSRQVLKLGDEVEYVGADRVLQAQCAGVLQIVDESPLNGFICLTQTKQRTTWIPADQLRLVTK